jgi:hypothetical protein
MLCESCHTNEATVHISNVVYLASDVDARHFCLGCAEVAKNDYPLLSSTAPSLPTVHANLVTSISTPAKAKVQSIEKKLAELDPVWEAFCSRRGYSFMPGRELCPYRAAFAHQKIDHRIVLTMDVAFTAMLEQGFCPDMPWSLYAMASLPFWSRSSGKPSELVPAALISPMPVLTFELFRQLPFAGLAEVLENQLERGFSVLRELTREDILRKGETPQDRPTPFRLYPW